MCMCERGMRDLDERGKGKFITVEIAYVDHFSVF